MNIGCIKLVTLFQSCLATDITTTRPRNLAWLDICYIAAVQFPDNYPPLDNAPQDVDNSCHLSDFTSTTNSLNETCSLDTSGDHLLHLDSPSLSSRLKDTSSVASVEVEFVPDFEEPLDNNNFQQLMFSLNNMTMTCSYSIKRLLHHLTISTIRTAMLVKSEVKMPPFSFMPPTLVTFLHYPNSWHNTTVKT